MALKIYEQSAKDTWNTDVLKKKKNPKRYWRAQKKEKPVFGNHSTTLNSEMRGKKVENVYSNVDFKRFTRLTPFLGISSIPAFIETHGHVCAPQALA